jgi:hypothetical protein
MIMSGKSTPLHNLIIQKFFNLHFHLDVHNHRISVNSPRAAHALVFHAQFCHESKAMKFNFLLHIRHQQLNKCLTNSSFFINDIII